MASSLTPASRLAIIYRVPPGTHLHSRLPGESWTGYWRRTTIRVCATLILHAEISA